MKGCRLVFSVSVSNSPDLVGELNVNYIHSQMITLDIYFLDTVEKKHLFQQTLFLWNPEHQIAPKKRPSPHST